MKEKIFVSIVVPVYNVEKYLHECLDSLVNQTLENIEIICVDNQSQDKSVKIIENDYLSDFRVKLIINEKNMGMPVSRNIGMANARGKYIAFVDSDDICDLTMFEKLFKMAEKTEADITTCSVYQFLGSLENRHIHRNLEWYKEVEQAVPITERPQQLIEPAGWCKLFKRKFIQSIDFQFTPNSVSCEDVPCITRAFMATQKIAFVQEALYFYRFRQDGNLTASMGRRHIDDYIWAMNQVKDILLEYDLTDAHTLSYIIEFKYLMAFYILSKLGIRDFRYYFKNILQALSVSEFKYLHRLFTYIPRYEFLFRMIIGGHWLIYTIYRVLRELHARLMYCSSKIISTQDHGVFKIYRIFGKEIKIVNRRNTRIVYQHQLETIHQINEQLHHAYYDIAEQQQDIQTLIQQNESKQQDIQTLIQQNESKRQDIQTLIQQNESKQQDIQTLIQQNESKQQDIQTLIQQNESKQQDIQTLIQQNESKQHLVYELSSQNKVKDEQIHDLSTYNNQITEHRDMLQKEVDSKQQFNKEVWCTGFIDNWKLYFQNTYSLLEEKKAILFKNLDEQSIHILKLLIKRNIEILPRSENTQKFLYDHEKIYEPWEIEGARDSSFVENVKRDFTVPTDGLIEPCTFKFHNGLKFLPQDVTEQIYSRDVIDGGAYWGDSALVINTYNPRSIHCFEPYQPCFEELKWTIKENQLTEVAIPVSLGLGKSSEDVNLYTYGLNSGSNLFNIDPSPREREQPTVSEIQLTTIDSYAAENDLDVGLIKLDVEGNEYDTIVGAKQTIIRCKPILLISIYHSPIDFFEIKPYIDELNLGYNFLVRKMVYHDLVTEVSLIAYC